MFEFALHNAWVIIAVPILASVLIAAFMKYLEEPKAGWFGTIAMGISFIWSVLTLMAVVGSGHGGVYGDGKSEAAARWLIAGIGGPFGGTTFDLGLMIDNLSAMTLVMVTLVSFCVQFYSIGYMHGDKRFVKYFSAVNLFTSGMLIAVMADNLLFLLIGWEIMGLCSYMLIGHWYEKEWPMYAAAKAFMTVRIGDTFMVVGIVALIFLTGSMNFNEVAVRVGELVKTPAGLAAVLTAGLLIFAGPIGKSAQFPLHTWLPDAMAGPTPGSALIHAATMVAVGVYLVARGFSIFAQAGLAGGSIMGVIALVGAFTSLFAASIATLRTDIKQVLAYSTISQLGYMILALGVGSFSAGTFHLMTHAFFKALLFLAAGSVIHAVHTQEMHQMGGLAKKIPITFWTWMVGYLALAGFPGFSGFFSKDELLLAAFNFSHSDLAPSGWPAWVLWLPFVMGALTALLTAYYMTRATILTFFGKPRDHHAHDHAHESHWLMTAPLVILAIPAALFGWLWAALPAQWLESIGIHAEWMMWWEHFTPQTFQRLPHDGAGLVTTIATLLGLTGILVGYLVYGRANTLAIRRQAITALRPVYGWVKARYYVDEFYEGVIVRGFYDLSACVGRFDQLVVDGIVNLVGAAGWAWGEVAGWFDRTFVDGIVDGAATLSIVSGQYLRRFSTGYVQGHMMTLAAVVVFGAVVVYMVLGVLQ